MAEMQAGTGTTVNWAWHRFAALSAEALYDILRLRQDVFMLEQSSLYADIDGRDPQASHLTGREGGGGLLAYARMFPATASTATVTMGRFVVAREVRGLGLARAMMDQCLHWLTTHAPASPVRISAQHHLANFYAGYGFCTAGEPYDDAGVRHIDMIRPAMK